MELNTCFSFADKFSLFPAVQLEQMLPFPLPRYQKQEIAETLEGHLFNLHCIKKCGWYFCQLTCFKTPSVFLANTFSSGNFS